MPTLYDNFERVKNFIDENNTSYVSKTELAYASYITQADLGQMSYATTSDLSSYLPKSGGTISGNILLNSSSINIGNSTTGLNNLYVTYISAKSGGALYFRNGSTNQVGINNGFLWPATNNAKTLGASNFQWKAAYTYSLYLGSTNIEDKFATPAYVANYVSTYATPVDLSAYVTKVDLNNASYVSQTSLSSMGYVTSSSTAFIKPASGGIPATIYPSVTYSSWNNNSGVWGGRYYAMTGADLKDWIWSYAASMFSYDTSTGTLTITTA